MSEDVDTQSNWPANNLKKLRLDILYSSFNGWTAATPKEKIEELLIFLTAISI